MSLKKALDIIRREISEEFAITGTTLYSVTETNELLAVTLDSSTHSAGVFYIWVYWMPLYAPTDGLYFNFGTRVGSHRNDSWTLPLLEASNNLEQLVTKIVDWKNQHIHREVRIAGLEQQLQQGSIHAGKALFYDFCTTTFPTQ